MEGGHASVRAMDSVKAPLDKPSHSSGHCRSRSHPQRQDLFHPIVLQDFARGCSLNSRPVDGAGPKKASSQSAGILLVELRTCFQTATATHASGHGVSAFVGDLGVNWTSTQVVGAIDKHPGLHTLEVVEQTLAIDHQVANHGEFAQGPKNNFDAFSGAYSSTNAAGRRTFPLITIVHDPHTSSRHHSRRHWGGVVALNGDRVGGRRCRHEIRFIPVSTSTWNRSHRGRPRGCLGRMRRKIVRVPGTVVGSNHEGPRPRL